jgi:uncharacterized protein
MNDVKQSKKPGSGLVFGILFGFLLQRSGVSFNDIIMKQLMLLDFTVVKVMLSAVVTGLMFVTWLNHKGYVKIQPKAGGIGMTIPGALLFGVGFALLGYCPGTLAAAIGQGSMDALTAGLPGILLGSWLFAFAWPYLNRTIINVGHWDNRTLPGMSGLSRGFVAVAAAFLCTLILLFLEVNGY